MLLILQYNDIDIYIQKKPKKFNLDKHQLPQIPLPTEFL